MSVCNKSKTRINERENGDNDLKKQLLHQIWIDVFN